MDTGTKINLLTPNLKKREEEWLQRRTDRPIILALKFLFPVLWIRICVVRAQRYGSGSKIVIKKPVISTVL